MKLNYAVCSWLTLAIAMLLVTTAARAQDDFQIIYHEPLGTLQLQPDKASAQSDAASENTPRGTKRLSITAFGQIFDMELQSNSRLMESIGSTQPQNGGASYTLYKGHLSDNDSSWVRLTDAGGQMTGAIWDGNELYAIEPYSNLASFLPQSAKYSSRQHIMYLASNMLDLSGAYCGVDHSVAQANRGYRQLVDHLQQSRAANAAGSQLNVNVVADVEFQNIHGNGVAAAVAARMNIVDGIFDEQVGVAINVSGIDRPRSNGTLGGTNPRNMLNALRNLSSSRQIANPGLIHLFTGRDLDGGTIGIAYLSAICSNSFGVGITQSNRGRSVLSVALTAAHELGHNFGAPHDNQGGACGSVPGTFLMNPFLNGSDQFSQCSVRQIQPVVNNASCLVAVGPDPDPDPALAELNVADAVANEGQFAQFKISLSKPTNKNVVFSVRTFNGTAFAGGDFDAKSGRRTIAAGQTSKTIWVKLKPDNRNEGQEQFRLVVVARSNNAVTGDGDATGTINDR